ncbi:MAG: hypothetical protein J6K04_09070 [Lachnospiraceae bacterium]|nr:hypothetical protein [Lachnospiraceae bacterium]
MEMNVKELEKVVLEQLTDMKVNTIADEGTDNYPVFLDRTETDNSKWLKLLTESLKSAKIFEIHCWNEEKEWIDMALQYGVIKEDDWKYGKIITGEVTQEFCDMLLGMPKPQDTELCNKMTPFFNVFLDSGFQSSHYGTEIFIHKGEFF